MTDAQVDVMLALIKDRVIEMEAEQFLGLDVNGCDISARTERKIRRTIRRERGTVTVLKRVALVAAIIMAMLFMMSFAFPEIREAYFLLFEGTPGKVSVSNGSNNLNISFEIGIEYSDDIGKLPAGEPSYIPEGYSIARIRENGDRSYEVIYENGDGKEISFDRDKVGVGFSFLGVDNHKYVAEEIKVNGYSGVLVTYPKDWWHQYILVFCDGSYEYFFHVVDKDITREELLRMAESVYE